MTMNIRLFATLKDRAGAGKISVPLHEQVTVAELLDTIGTAYPALVEALPATLVAVNRNYAERDTVVTPSDEVALFPPVSGG